MEKLPTGELSGMETGSKLRIKSFKLKVMAMTYGGIQYYPISVVLFDEVPMELTEAKFGMKGTAAVMKLLSKIYKESGYYLLWGKEQCTLFTNKAGRELTEDEMQGIVDILVEKAFFDKETYEKYGILTSVEIQKVWLEATKRRKRDLASLPYMLVKTEEETKEDKTKKGGKDTDCMQNPQNSMQHVDNSPENADNSGQSIAEHSIGEENKELPPLTPLGENGEGTTDISFYEIPGYAYNKQTHNLECLLLRLDQLCIIDPKEIKSILKLSNYGKLGGYVWKVISNARWSTVDSKGAYLISSLRKERNNQ